MGLNEMEIYKLVSDLQMRAALITSISIICVGCVLNLICGEDIASFLFLIFLSVAAIGGVSAIRYTIFCRDKVYGGTISYIQSFLFGFRFFLLSGMVITLGVYSFLRFHPNFFIDFFEEVEQQYQLAVSSGVKLTISHDELFKEREMVLSMSAYSLSLQFMFFYLFCGATSALVYSLFITKKA